jgi:hypothetical protein
LPAVYYSLLVQDSSRSGHAKVSEYLLKRFLSERNSSPEAWKSHSTFQPGNTSIMDLLRDRDRNLEATNPVLSACRNLAAA